MIDKLIFTVTPIFSIPPRGAAAVETWIYQVAKRTRIPNRIACIREDGFSEKDIVNERCSIHRIGFSRLYKRIFQKWSRIDPIPYSQRVLNIAKDFNITNDSIIIVHNSMKLYRQIREKAPDAKMIMHMHNAFTPKGLDSNVKMLVPSQYLKDFYEKHLPDAEICIVPNGTEPHNLDKELPPLTKQDLGIPSEKKVIFYAGRISPEKGTVLLLQAFKKLIKSCDNIELVVVGDYNNKDKGEKAAYQKQVRELAGTIGSRCHLVGGVKPDDMYRYYPIADLVVIPSQFQEPFCMVAIEAMGAGRPVLVSTRGGMVEFVKNNHTGFHINEPMLPESLASDIYETLHSEKLEQIANNGKKYVLENYLWWQVTHKFENVL
ncbi:TPA: lipopolysaccharide N-acetylglucosaminyltransferase, partial [Escherichia coli]